MIRITLRSFKKSIRIAGSRASSQNTTTLVLEKRQKKMENLNHFSNFSSFLVRAEETKWKISKTIIFLNQNNYQVIFTILN